MSIKSRILAALLLASAVITSACAAQTADGDKSDSVTTAEQTTAVETDYIDSLPDIDYEGYGFTFWTRQCCKSHTDGLYQENETGDVVNDAVYVRNRIVEGKYNIVIAEPILGPDAEPTPLINAVLANEHMADVAIPHFRFLGDMALKGLLVDMGTLEYLNFNQPWWYTNMIENYSIYGKYYTANGDIGIDNITQLGCLFFNKRLAGEYLDGDIYQTVRDKKWTLDKMLECVTLVGQDLNGDGNVTLDDDLFGYTSYAGYMFMFQYGANQPTTERDDENTPQLVINSSKMAGLVEKVYSIATSQYAKVAENMADSYFLEGRSLFLGGVLNNTTYTEFRSMTDNFGILPYPLFDTNQDMYYSHAASHSSLIGIPITNPDLERASLILEALVSVGYEKIRPALYDIALKVKTVRDDDSADMIDLIIAGYTGDFADLYDEWGLVYTLDTLVGRNGKSDFASYYASNESATLKRLETAVEAFKNQ